ncbi:MAG TPA: gentisate 1,2-dioxygenase [Candidatus Cybelea sp.]|nr:gentisate 1,2-dioxygenase [Candidatus Cybelea sp.]
MPAEAMSATHAKPLATPERDALYRRMAPLNLAPLWEVLHGLIVPEPKSAIRPAIWHYDEVRPYLMEAGRLITAKEAERRVLVLENPGLPGQSRITTSLYAGLQLILPGEVAPAHRHSQSALRFIVEGHGAYTSVDGEKTLMEPGDFVITPSWTWHDHGNDTKEPMVWLDGLDIPLVQSLDASFAEGYGEDMHPITRPVGDSLARYGSGLLPIDYQPAAPTSPVFNYPYARTREALERMRRVEQWDACHGLKMQYVNPANGDYAMPTIAAFMQLLPKAFVTAPYRSSDATVFSVVEGTGESTIGGETFAWGPRDTFVVPSWHRHWHRADGDAVLFSFSDRPVQRKLGLWREDRGNH